MAISSDPYRFLAFVDLETTGARPTTDRITEVGIILTDDGVEVEEWSSLVDPGVSIPWRIQQLTGIHQEMVAGQPSFAEVAPLLLERLAGRVVVAHNARFDLGFLRHAYTRLDIAFNPSVVCTVKLSRRLFPEYRRHNLDTLISRFGLECGERHRALEDARLLPALVRAMAKQVGEEALVGAMAEQQTHPSLPPHVDPAVLDELPRGPGVYLFYGEEDALLYVGKSVNLRSRVMSHFTDAHQNDRAMRLAQQLRRIDWEETCGDFGALVREAELIKARAPIHNRRARRTRYLVSIAWTEHEAVKLVRLDGKASNALDGLHGLFKSEKQAKKRLQALASEHQLCLRRLGLESGRGRCFGHQLGRCKGVCCGEESVRVHDMRIAVALRPLKLHAWPYPGPVGIVETHPGSRRQVMHIIDRWCYLGRVEDENQLTTFDWRHHEGLDQDIYRLCVRRLQHREEVHDLSHWCDRQEDVAAKTQ